MSTLLEGQGAAATADQHDGRREAGDKLDVARMLVRSTSGHHRRVGSKTDPCSGNRRSARMRRFVTPLVVLSMSSRRASAGGFTRSWSVYSSSIARKAFVASR